MESIEQVGSNKARTLDMLVQVRYEYINFSHQISRTIRCTHLFIVADVRLCFTQVMNFKMAQAQQQQA
jgi:hypothetical protein